MGLETKSQTRKRHLKEVKAMKQDYAKQIKSAKNKALKKELKAKAKAALDDLEKTHKQELENFTVKTAPETDTKVENTTPTISPPPQKKKTRAQRRRERKAMEEKQFYEQIEQDRIENGPPMRRKEMNAFFELLTPLGLKTHTIKADGHCLFSALEHQLTLLNPDNKIDYMEVRRLCAAHLTENMSEYQPFLLNENNDLMSDEEFKVYCRQVAGERTPSGKILWGGETEVAALAKMLKKRIEVYSYGLPKPRNFGEESDERPLRISYHRFLFGLSEHYNSVVPLKLSEEKSDSGWEETK